MIGLFCDLSSALAILSSSDAAACMVQCRLVIGSGNLGDTGMSVSSGKRDPRQIAIHGPGFGGEMRSLRALRVWCRGDVGL